MSFWIHCDEETCKEVCPWKDDELPDGWIETSCRERPDIPTGLFPDYGLLAIIEKACITVIRHFCSKHQFPKHKAPGADPLLPEFKLDPELERLIKQVKLPGGSTE